MRTGLDDIREAIERVDNANVKVSRRDVMLVAWDSFKSYKRVGIERSFAQCLRNAWAELRVNMYSFLVSLHEIVKSRRKKTLKGFDIMKEFRGVKNGTHVEISFCGQWWESYEWLFNLKIK